jgi:3-hydroxyacyl-[acyl-carrier-protein] dehydratase
MAITDNVIMDVEKIKSLIPHRHPFLLIDSVHEIVKGEKIIASKFLSIEEPVFAGHFPGNPIYPGVYYIESIAQAGAILLFESKPEITGSLGMLSGIEESRFRRPCKPGERVHYEVSLEKSRAMFFWIKGKAFVGNELVAEAKISVAIISNHK